MIKFSLLVAHYNNIEYFVECYKSLINQTFTDYEIIIVDDCSTGDSFEKLKNFVKENPKVKLYQNAKNKGVGYTKRRCAELASGEILGFVDPDDAITNDAVEELIKHYSNDKIVAVYSQFSLCDKHLQAIKVFQKSRQTQHRDPYFFNVFLKTNHFFTFRKSAYEKTEGINPALTSAVDQDLYLKLYETGNFKFVKKPLYLYRTHENGVSQAKSKKNKLFYNWNSVILSALERRKITLLYGKKIFDIPNLSFFIYNKQNTIFARLIRKLKWSVFS